ncbi:hypothetical protein F4775DRAFT_35734 [Biscogniauxia sp. FL1348]|nr:hypothetical protein F4775DRAFT_35734 [Biscogniauxia sp. FL1348]
MIYVSCITTLPFFFFFSLFSFLCFSTYSSPPSLASRLHIGQPRLARTIHCPSSWLPLTYSLPCCETLGYRARISHSLIGYYFI